MLTINTLRKNLSTLNFEDSHRAVACINKKCPEGHETDYGIIYERIETLKMGLSKRKLHARDAYDASLQLEIAVFKQFQKNRPTVN
jgi:hypothetical protein